MNSNEPAIVTPVAAEAGAQAEHRSFPRDLVNITKAAVVYLVTDGALLGIVLSHDV